MREGRLRRVQEEFPVPEFPGEEGVEFPIAVHVVEDERVPDRGEMPANLVVAAGFDHGFDGGGIAEPLEDGIGGFRIDEIRGIPRVTRGMPRRQPFLNDPASTFNPPRDEAPVLLRPLIKFCIQNVARHLLPLREEEYPGRLEVEPVHRRETGVIFLQEIEEGQFPDRPAPFHGKLATELVHGEEMLVFEEDAMRINGHRAKDTRIVRGPEYRTGKRSFVTEIIRHIPQISRVRFRTSTIPVERYPKDVLLHTLSRCRQRHRRNAGGRGGRSFRLIDPLPMTARTFVLPQDRFEWVRLNAPLHRSSTRCNFQQRFFQPLSGTGTPATGLVAWHRTKGKKIGTQDHGRRRRCQHFPRTNHCDIRKYG